jgi:hypothetical protein
MVIYIDLAGLARYLWNSISRLEQHAGHGLDKLRIVKTASELNRQTVCYPSVNVDLGTLAACGTGIRLKREPAREQYLLLNLVPVNAKDIEVYSQSLLHPRGLRTHLVAPHGIWLYGSHLTINGSNSELREIIRA